MEPRFMLFYVMLTEAPRPKIDLPFVDIPKNLEMIALIHTEKTYNTPIFS